MTLKTSVQARIANKLLVELTNQNDPTAEAINGRVLDQAIDDAEGTFLIEVGLAYDDTDATHVPVGVQGVLYFLQLYTGVSGTNLDNTRQRWERGLIALAATRGSERRLLPTTNSVLLPSDELTDSLPDHDRSRWGGVVPRMPVIEDEVEDVR